MTDEDENVIEITRDNHPRHIEFAVLNHLVAVNPALSDDARMLWTMQSVRLAIGARTATKAEFMRQAKWGKVRINAAISELKEFGLAGNVQRRNKRGQIFNTLEFRRWPAPNALRKLAGEDSIRKAIGFPSFATEVKRMKADKPSLTISRREGERIEEIERKMEIDPSWPCVKRAVKEHEERARSVTQPPKGSPDALGSTEGFPGSPGPKGSPDANLGSSDVLGKSIDLPANPPDSPPKREDSEHHQIIKAWCEVFEEATGEAYLIGPRDAKAVKVLREAGITLSEARRLITEAFEVAATQDKSKAFAVHVATESLWQFADRLGGVKKAIAGLDGKRRIKKTTPEATKNGLDEMSRRLNASHSPRHL